jgi:hypothetical protein
MLRIVLTLEDHVEFQTIYQNTKKKYIFFEGV